MIRRSLAICTFFSLVVVCLFGTGFVLRGKTTVALEPASTQSLERVTGNFVIADFDGDQKPDLATVKLDRTNSQTTNYSIQFQLSEGWQSAIGITARAGGLKLSWRDVNGDDAPDLVVRNSLDSTLVAVLLNDGHGNFTQAPTKLFSGLEKEPEFFLEVERGPQVEGVSTLPLRTSFGEESEQAGLWRLQSSSEPIDRLTERRFSSFLSTSSTGRAPPSFC